MGNQRSSKVNTRILKVNTRATLKSASQKSNISYFHEANAKGKFKKLHLQPTADVALKLLDTNPGDAKKLISSLVKILKDSLSSRKTQLSGKRKKKSLKKTKLK